MQNHATIKGGGMVPPRLAYSIEEAAVALGIGRTLLYKLIKAGEIRVVKVGDRTLLPVREVEAFLLRQGGAA